MTRDEWESARYGAVCALLRSGFTVPQALARLESLVPISDDIEGMEAHVCPVCGHVAVGATKLGLHARKHA